MWTRPKPESLTGGDVFHLDLVSELPLRVGVQHQDRGAVLGHHFRGRAVDCGELTGRYRRRLDARCAPGAFDGRRSSVVDCAAGPVPVLDAETKRDGAGE